MIEIPTDGHPIEARRKPDDSVEEDPIPAYQVCTISVDFGDVTAIFRLITPQIQLHVCLDIMRCVDSDSLYRGRSQYEGSVGCPVRRLFSALRARRA